MRAAPHRFLLIIDGFDNKPPPGNAVLDSVLVRREALRGKEKIPPGSGRDASLIAFLESLDEKQRYSALVHLSVLWAQSHDKNTGRDRE